MDRRDFIKTASGSIVLAGTPRLVARPEFSYKTGIPKKGSVVSVVNGHPEVFIDGQLASRMWARLALPSELAVDKLTQYTPAGIQIYFTGIDWGNTLCWDGDDGYDFRPYEEQLEKLIKVKPDIKLIPYVGIRDGAPYRWCKKYPNELLKLHNGLQRMAASFGSKIWLKESLVAYRRFVEHFENSDYADNIVGYNPVSNSGNEWWGYSGDVHSGLADYADPMRDYFREWLKEYYDGQVAELRSQWKNKSVTFETAEIPTVEQRMADDTFLHAEKHGRQCADFYRCFNDANAQRAVLTCKTIKEALKTPKLVGLMHGYSYARGRFRGIPQMQGHGSAKTLFDCQYIDFFQSPYDYQNRSFGGPHFSQHAVNSIHARGKFFVDQIDTKTHLRYPPNRNAETPWESEQILKRDAAFSLTRNSGCYWFEGGPGNMVIGAQHSPIIWCPMWYDSPEIKKLISQLKAVHDENRDLKTESVTEVAVVTSNNSNYYRQVESVWGAMFVQAQRNWEMNQIGVPFDDYLLEDFEKINRSYKVYIFLNSIYVSSSLRKKIADKLQHDGATALWFYAPGYLDEKGSSFENTKLLTGLYLNAIEKKDYLHVDLQNHALTQNMIEKDYGTDCDPSRFQKGLKWQRWPMDKKEYRFSPVFCGNDSEAETIGLMRGAGKPGLIRKKVGRSVSIYSGAPVLPAALMRNILAESGVHLYSPAGDLIYANSRYLAVCCNGDGKKTVKLTEKSNVVDAITGKKIASKTEKIQFDGRHGEVRLYKVV